MLNHFPDSSPNPEPPYWLSVISGCAAVIAGVMLAAAPAIPIVRAAGWMGLFWMFQGALLLVAFYLGYARRFRLLLLVSGVLGVACGIVSVRHPALPVFKVPEVLVVTLAAGGLLMGLFLSVLWLRGVSAGVGALGLANLFSGLAILSSQLVRQLGLPVLLAVILIPAGVLAICLGIREKKARAVPRGPLFR